MLFLTWDQVDLEAGTARLAPGSIKNKDGRVIAFPQVLRQILEPLWQEHLTRSQDCPWVFHNQG
ncbi:MAG: hypothetical protein HYZ72_00025 [Deltaproteobacteria bacterium]|nr:hypothetical protein [Deltaproteobacteria bacterium]